MCQGVGVGDGKRVAEGIGRFAESGSRGDFEKARKLYAVLTPLYHLDTVVKLVQHIKLAENILTGSAETVKAPRLNLDGAERENTIAIVNKTVADLKALGY